MPDIAARALKTEDAFRLLPQSLRPDLHQLSPVARAETEELRLRAGFPLAVLLPSGERPVGERVVIKADLDAVLDIATGASAYAAKDTLRAGYVTAKGGFRIGFAGSVLTKNGEPMGFRELSSLAIRIPREKRGVADDLLPALFQNGLRSALILSPPGAGKTTLLRDLVRVLSDGDLARGVPPRRVGLADERGEIASLHGGAAQLYVGAHTDVLDNCPKSEAVMLLLRVMNPEMIALDEITNPDDARALLYAVGCGVKLLATAHAANLDDLTRRPLYRDLLAHKVFDIAVVITNRNGARAYTVEMLP